MRVCADLPADLPYGVAASGRRRAPGGAVGNWGGAMITAIVNFRLPDGTSAAEAARMFRESAPRYRGVPGLVRKYHVLGEDGTGGGGYLWESREAADALYTDA